jgi:hypothetical protein
MQKSEDKEVPQAAKTAICSKLIHYSDVPQETQGGAGGSEAGLWLGSPAGKNPVPQASGGLGSETKLDSGGLHLVAELVGARGRRRRRSRPGAGVAGAPVGGRPLGTPRASGNSKIAYAKLPPVAQVHPPNSWDVAGCGSDLAMEVSSLNIDFLVPVSDSGSSRSSWSSVEGGDVPASTNRGQLEATVPSRVGVHTAGCGK